MKKLTLLVLLVACCGLAQTVCSPQFGVISRKLDVLCGPSTSSSTPTAVTRVFNGLGQAGVAGWNLSWDALTNITQSTVDSTHITPLLVVTANTTGSGLRSSSPVTSAVTSVVFSLRVRSTDQVNAGSMALSYSCVTTGTMDAPTFTTLTAIPLATISATNSTYTSTQAVACTGTASAPARLWVTWTPTAPSGGTLSIAELGVTY